MLLEALPLVDGVASLGAAGIMGAMWLVERRASQKRDDQLSQTHQRILADRDSIESLVTLVRQNTEALTRLSAMLDDHARHER
jgi:hypothetical protein